jgi:hypothetical protein
MRKIKHPQPSIRDELEALPLEAREHLMQLITLLLQCYGAERTASAVLIVQPADEEAVVIASANADDMEAATIIAEAHGIMGTVLVANAPPKEMFN